MDEVMKELADISVMCLEGGFDAKAVASVLLYTFRKWKKSGESEDYLPILYQNELRDFILRKKINDRWERGNERNACCA